MPPIAATFALMDYLMVLDAFMNLEYRFSKLQEFSFIQTKKLREQYGIPHPMDKVTFAILSLAVVYIAKRLLGSFFGGKNQSQFRFNSPDFAEIGVLVTSVKKLQEDIVEIKKSVALDPASRALQNANPLSERMTV